MEDQSPKLELKKDVNMEFISAAEWAEYEKTINDFAKDAAQQDIVWHKSIRSINSEGNDFTPLYQDKTIKGLVQYNYFRAWPINADTKTGEVDKESLLVFFHNEVLAEMGLLNANGVFEFKPSLDKFSINGVRYVTKGDSQAAQTGNSSPLLHFIIFLRDYEENV